MMQEILKLLNLDVLMKYCATSLEAVPNFQKIKTAITRRFLYFPEAHPRKSLASAEVLPFNLQFYLKWIPTQVLSCSCF